MTIETDVIRISIDPGNGYFKGGVAEDNQIRVALLPSVVGIGRLDTGLAGRGLGRQKADKPRLVTIGKSVYLAGQNVADYGRPVERLDPGRFVDGGELRALFYATLGDLLDPGATSVAIVVGLPVEVLQQDDAKRTVREMRKWMKKIHRFSIGPDPYRVTVKDVQVVAQPLGAYFAWGAGTQGTWIREKGDMAASVAFLDVGFQSLDLFVVKNAVLQPRWTAGRNVGMRRACALVSELIYTAHGRELSLHEADALLRLSLKNKPAMISVPGGPANVADLATTALEIARGEALAFCESKWGNGKQFAYILLVGGGAIAYQPALARLFPDSTLIEDAQTANVRGLAYLANRPGYLKV
jgi:hypothetical protein